MINFVGTSLFRYIALPEFRQRFAELFASGFQYVPYFMAQVYATVRLLPPAHPYLRPENMGRFGLRHVIAEAANNIVLSRKNIDQILLFVTILMGLVLAALQILVVGMAILVPAAMAAMPSSFAGFFLTPDPEQDLAHMFLDMVFGVPDLFNSCVARQTACLNISGETMGSAAEAPGGDWIFESSAFPTPMHDGLHRLFQTYNIGLTVVGVFITLYFVFTVLAETAQTGTPFGKRFNKVWAPVRFVVAFGLLFPVGVGYSSAQYIVLYAAKFGSGFATNGWNLFNDTLEAATADGLRNLTSGSAANAEGLVGTPNVPEISGVLQFLYTAKTCVEVHEAAYGSTAEPIEMYLVKDPMATPNHLKVTVGTGYNAFLNFLDGSNQAIIRFGVRDEGEHGHMMGFVFPTCGEMSLKLTDPRPEADAEPGVSLLQKYYWYVIRELWFDVFPGNTVSNSGENYPRNTARYYESFNKADTSSFGHDSDLPLPDNEWKKDLYEFYYDDLKEVLTAESPSGNIGALSTLGAQTGAVNEMGQSARWEVDVNLRKKGWAGAAVWYNRIAEMNGGLISAALNIPMPTRYPHVMETVHLEKRQSQEDVGFGDRFNPRTVDKDAKTGLDSEQVKIAYVLWEAFDFWQHGGVGSSQASSTKNAVVDIINALFGTEGLYNMRENTNVHPLAQLAGVGRSLVESAIRNLTYATVGGASMSLLTALFDNIPGAAGISSVSSFLVTFSMVGLTAGFILFYVVPFLPFIYFFFAVGGWIKGMFEAMVGAPLWALAHLRIDGNGLSGQAATSGYFLIFEVFLRPILIVFGMLASISIFSALISVLNQIFDLVVSNVSGFDAMDEYTGGSGISKLADMRSAIDKFFFTIIYTIIVYLMGLSSFKLVDLIPNNILRWMGQSVAAFGDQQEDFGQKLVGSATVGSQQTLRSVGSGLNSLIGARGG